MDTALGSKVTACLLTYNHAHLVGSTLESVLAQSLRGYEVLVSDDVSTDGTWEAVVAAAERDPRVRVVQPPHNLGMAGNANFAVDKCDRPYVALLHHDDLYREDLLEKWADLLARFPDVAFVFNPYGVDGSDYVYREPIPPGRIDGRWLLEHYLLPRWGCLVRGTAMVRRSAWEALGGMRTQFGMLADVDLWMRLARRWPVGYVDEPIVTIRQARPAYYPSAYQNHGWSWARQRLLYDIHATNRLETLDLASIRGKLAWQAFRLRLSTETAKWLAYAVARRKPEMLLTSLEGATEHDPALLKTARAVLVATTRVMGR